MREDKKRHEEQLSAPIQKTIVNSPKSQEDKKKKKKN